MKCDCDAFSDAPCPSHGYGTMECECGAAVRAPLVVRGGWDLMCTCRRRYVGVEDAAHGFWKPIQKPWLNKAMAWEWAAAMLEIQLTNWERSGEKSPENTQEAEHIRSVIIPNMKTKADIIRRNRKAP